MQKHSHYDGVAINIQYMGLRQNLINTFLVVFMYQGQPQAYILSQKRGGVARVSRRRQRMLAAWLLRGGVGRWDSYRSHFSRGSLDVSGSIFADRMWLRLQPSLERSRL